MAKKKKIGGLPTCDHDKRISRIEMSYKIRDIIEESVIDLCGSSPNAKGMVKAKSLFEKWGIEYENLREVRMSAAVMETVRMYMDGKVCVDAPDWFNQVSRVDPEEVPPTVLYVPEELAFKILALGYLPKS